MNAAYLTIFMMMLPCFLSMRFDATCPSPQYMEMHKTGVISCIFPEDIVDILWYNTTDYRRNDPILHYRNLKTSGPGYESGEFDIDASGSLIIKQVSWQHEHTFRVAYLKSNQTKPVLLDVQVVVTIHPVPEFPVIEGCDFEQYCSLKANHKGNLTCRVNGIRPQVQLEWKTHNRSDASAIVFTNHLPTVKDNGATFDVTLTVAYEIRDNSLDRLSMECKVSELHAVFGMTSTIDLFFVKGILMNSTEPTNLERSPSLLPWIVPVILIVILLGCFVSGMIAFNCVSRKRKLKEKTSDSDEMTRLRKDECFTEEESEFLNQLRKTYMDLCNGVQPVPSTKNGLFCVNKIFVESGIEVLDSSGEGTNTIWKSRNSYQSIFNDHSVQSKRIIIEGKPGYGKSTLALKFAYDWCSSSPDSALKILIFLRLRQIKGVTSIYAAIKKFILTADSRLTERDIENILENNHSVVFILEGYDEYPDKHNPTSDINEIIAKRKFPDIQVVVTTRSTFLPKDYPSLTKRVRLTGFDDFARRNYLRKAEGVEDEQFIEDCEKYLTLYPMFTDLFQVPLFYVMFSHIMLKNKSFQKRTSVTKFSSCLVSCLHSHFKNKLEAVELDEYEQFENNHSDLDEAAYDALREDCRQKRCGKFDIRQKLRKKVCNQYIRIGILVQENCADIDGSNFSITDNLQYKMRVKFHHKVFCEWYAAHYLSNQMKKNPDLDLKGNLHHLHPFDVECFYRFCCGLNSDSATKIIDYVKCLKNGDNFAILFIMEQTHNIYNKDKIDTIKQTIGQLCLKGVTINGYDSLRQQLSSMHLLNIATEHKITAEYVKLHNFIQAEGHTPAAIKTTADIDFTANIQVKELVVSLSNRKMSDDEFICILKFAAGCSALRYLSLSFDTSEPPCAFQIKDTLSSLKSAEVTVKYCCGLRDYPVYTLNLDTGRWVRDDDDLQPKMNQMILKE